MVDDDADATGRAERRRATTRARVDATVRPGRRAMGDAETIVAGP